MSGVTLIVAKIFVKPSEAKPSALRFVTSRGDLPTFTHDIALDTLDSFSQAIHPGSDLLCEPLPSIFSSPICFFSPLCVLNFVL